MKTLVGLQDGIDALELSQKPTPYNLKLMINASAKKTKNDEFRKRPK